MLLPLRLWPLCAQPPDAGEAPPATLARDGGLPRNHHERLYVKVPGGDSLRKTRPLARSTCGERMARGGARADPGVLPGALRENRARPEEGPPAQEGPRDLRPAAPAPLPARSPRRPSLALPTEDPSVLRLSVRTFRRYHLFVSLKCPSAGANMSLARGSDSRRARRCRRERGVPPPRPQPPPVIARPTRTRATSPSGTRWSASTSSRTARLPGSRDVTEEQWGSAQGQRAHTVNTFRFFTVWARCHWAEPHCSSVTSR